MKSKYYCNSSMTNVMIAIANMTIVNERDIRFTTVKFGWGWAYLDLYLKKSWLQVDNTKEWI